MKFILVVIIILVVIQYLKKRKKTKTPSPALLPDNETDKLLSAHVDFYKQLSSEEQQLFRKRVQHFLDTTAITPVGDAAVTDLDRLYVASSAIIPIFHFKDWAYNNLNEVLIYPGTFTKDFDVEDESRNVLGMVGDGAMHRVMILSLPALREGFEAGRPGNTGIHEFVHLLDKADGATDGLPEYMIPKSLVEPWTRYMHRTIHEIRNNHSGINPYAATNEAEFFAVISEYFFQKPHFLEAHHPELYAILEKIYGVEA